MTISRRRFIAISAAAAFAPGRAISAEKQPLRWTGTALGARASLTVIGMEDRRFARLIDTVTAEINRLENVFSLYRNDSVLASLNTYGRLDNPPADMVRLLSLAASVNRSSGGAFDPTVQPLWRAYADADGNPEAEALQRARKLTGWDKVRFDSNAVSYRAPGMAMTLNGIAQGYITDRIADLLRANGLRNVLVSAGEIAALGERRRGMPWRVGVTDIEDRAAEETVQLRDNAIATSSQSGMRFGTGTNAGHILDPRTGLPVDFWRRVSVINPSAAIADGLSTAFCAMSKPEISQALSRFRGTRLIAIDQSGERFTDRS